MLACDITVFRSAYLSLCLVLSLLFCREKIINALAHPGATPTVQTLVEKCRLMIYEHMRGIQPKHMNTHTHTTVLFTHSVHIDRDT